MDNDMIRQKAVDTLKLESEAVAKLVSNVNDEFLKVVHCILDCPARVIVTVTRDSARPTSGPSHAVSNATGWPPTVNARLATATLSVACR